MYKRLLRLKLKLENKSNINNKDRIRKRDKIKKLAAAFLLAFTLSKSKNSPPAKEPVPILRINNNYGNSSKGIHPKKTKEAFIGTIIADSVIEKKIVVDQEGRIIKKVEERTNRFQRGFRRVREAGNKQIEEIKKNILKSVQNILEPVRNRIFPEKVNKPLTFQEKIHNIFKKFFRKAKNRLTDYSENFKLNFSNLKRWAFNSWSGFRYSLKKEIILFFKNAYNLIEISMVGIYKVGYFGYKTLKLIGRATKTTWNGVLILGNLITQSILTPTLLIWDSIGLTVNLITVTVNELSIFLKKLSVLVKLKN